MRAERRTRGGHMSGDTPVSALSIPDALFKPGAGCAAPEPASTGPADRRLADVLDSLTDIINLIRRRWDEARDSTGRPFLVEALESQAAITVRNLRAAIPEDAHPEDARPEDAP